MDRISQAIEAHERDLSARPPDRRRGLIELWKQFRPGSPAEPVINLALQLIEDGTSNEVELGFYILMGLGLADASLLSHLRALTHHRTLRPGSFRPVPSIKIRCSDNSRS